MFLDESGIAILFRLINFFVFVFLILYVCKKYLLDTIKKQIVDKYHAMVHLHDQANTLEQEIRLIDQVIQQDAQLCQALKKRVVAWRAHAEYFAQENREKQQAQAKRLQQHMHMQIEYLKRKNTYERMLPQVIDQTGKKLEQKFEDEVLAQEFITQLITSMQKGG